MYKCKNCGAEFEGKFCPECGTKRPEKLFCSECGAEAPLGSRFCSECGHAFESGGQKPENIGGNEARQTPYESRQQTYYEHPRRERKAEAVSGGDGVLEKVYAFLRYVPIIMLALFSALLWLFYLAPVASASLLGMSDDSGSVYAFEQEVRGGCILFVVFGFIALVYTIVALCLFFKAKYKHKEYRLFGKMVMTLGEIVAVFSVVLYLLGIIFAAVVIGQIAEFDQGSGIVKPGAAVNLVLAFSIVFMILASAAIVTRIVLGVKNPYMQTVESNKRRERDKERAALSNDGDDFWNGNGASNTTSTENTQNTVVTRQGEKPLLYYAYTNLKMQRAVRLAFTAVCLSMAAVFVLMLLTLVRVIYFVSPHLPVIIGTAVAVIVFVLCLIIPIKNWSPEKFRDIVSKKRRHDKGKTLCKKVVFLYMLLVPIIVMLTIFATGFDVIMRGYVIAAVYDVVASVALFIAENAIAKRNNAIAEHLFGHKGPAPGASLIVAYSETAELAAYDGYKQAVKNKAVSDSDEVKGKLRSRRIKFGVAGALFAAISLFAMIAMPVMTDKFSSSYVAAFPHEMLGEEQFYFYFGTPHFAVDTSSEVTLAYYDRPYLDLYEKSNSLNKQMEQAVQKGDLKKLASLETQLQELELKAQTVKYKGLVFRLRERNANYGNSSSEPKIYDYINGGSLPNFYWMNVEEVMLDTNASGLDSEQSKTPKTVKLENAEFLRYANSPIKTIYAEITYTDGSYRYAPVSTSAFVELDTSILGRQTVKWGDKWGKYSALVNVVSTTSGKFSTNSSPYFSLDYKLTIDGKDDVKLELSNLDSSYSIASFPENTPWNEYKYMITEISFDKSFDANFMMAFDFSSYGALKDITVASNSENLTQSNGMLFNGDKTKLIKVVEDKAEIIVPDTVTEIEKGALNGLKNLQSLTIPFVGSDSTYDSYTVKKLGYIFAEVSSYSSDYNSYVPSSLKKVTVTGGSQIGEKAFDGCKNLTEVILPNTLTEIGAGAFYNCSRLTAITLPFVGSDAAIYNGSKTDFGYIFGSSSSSGNSYVPSSLKTVTITKGNTVPGVGSLGIYIPGRSFDGCVNIEKIELPDDLVTISGNAFSGCINLKDIVIPSAVLSIGSYAFKGCSSLTEINIPSSVTTIGEEAFYGCAELENIVLPDSLKTLDESTFRNCTSLGEITLPDALTEIGKYAFDGCTNLGVITLPKTLVSIGSYAFRGCSRLTSVTVPDTVTSIGSGAFGGCNRLASITLPFVGGSINGNTYFGYIFGASSYGNNSSSVPTALKTVIITKDTDFASNAFYGCGHITSVTIPTSVTSIGSNAFYNCSGLTEINYKGTTSQWQAISKANTDWKSGTGNFTVKCTNGNITKTDA